MNLTTQFTIKNNPYLYRYLREHSYWYKELNRNPESIYQLEQEMKETYKLTTKDKIDNISKKIELVRTFMDVLK